MSSKTFKTIFGLLLCVTLADMAQAAPVQVRFSDWLVTCNNQNYCQTRNVGQHHGLVLSLSRSAGARGDMALRIELGSLYAPSTRLPAIEGRLLLDDAPLEFNKKVWEITPHRLQTTDASTITTLVRTLANGKNITLQNDQGNIALDGLQTALMFIDTQQQRNGNQSAWVQTGDALPAQVPPVPALAVVKTPVSPVHPLNPQELSDLLDYGTWRMNNSQCSMDPGLREIRVSALTDDKALMMFSCESGAYNVVDQAWVTTRQKPFRAHRVHLRLPFDWDGQNGEVELMNTDFDDATHELSTLNKGRGFGDCGIASRWRYVGQQFSLVRLAAMPVCDGQQTYDAWPTLWVTH